MLGNKYSRRSALLGAAALVSAARMPTRANPAGPFPFDRPNTSAKGDGGYRSMGVGGGGAMFSPAFSPHENLWFVGCDMGTLYVSRTNGTAWEQVHNFQTAFMASIGTSLVGFATRPQIVFHALIEPGRARRSGDGGQTFDWIDYDFRKDRIRYWYPILNGGGQVFAGGENGLFKSEDDGLTWKVIAGIAGRSIATVADLTGPTPVLFHATSSGVFKSVDMGTSFQPVWQASVSGFAGGFDTAGKTLAAIAPAPGGGDTAALILWLAGSEERFAPRDPVQQAGDYVRMADNNSQVIYVTGAANWPQQTGTSIWVSENAGKEFKKRLLQYDWAAGYVPWPADKIEYSAVGLDIGWDDASYHGFAVTQNDARVAGGTGNYFFHVTANAGVSWQAPFTEYAEAGGQSARTQGQRWRSRGLEVTSIRYFKCHPVDRRFAIATGCDHHTVVTEDGGETWRLRRGAFNTIYDVAFDRGSTGRAFGVMGGASNWGHSGNYIPLPGANNGGVALFDRATGQWSPLETQGFPLNCQCLSVLYDEQTDELYVGTQGIGVAKGKPAAGNWRWMNEGFVGAAHVVPQLAMDPVSRDVYALLASSDQNGLPENAGTTGIYRLNKNVQGWELLRRAVEVPPGKGEWKDRLMGYPTSFAIDWRGTPGKRALFVTDSEQPFGTYRCTGLWRAYEDDLTWRLVLQHQGASHVQLENESDDHRDSSRVYLSGNMNGGDTIILTDESIGNFGALYSDRWGEPGSWKRNEAFPAQAHLWSTVPSPYDPNEVIYTCFGAGVYRGPRPT